LAKDVEMHGTGTPAGFLALLLSLLLAHPAVAQLPGDYPDSGKAVDALDIDDDYSDVLAERPRSISIMRARAHGFVPSDEMQIYVHGILTRLLEGIALPPSFDPQIRILAAPDYGAVCTPDGTLVVSVGLLEQSETEDEIAFILGHEVSHAILRHHDSDWFTRAQYYAVVNARSLSDVTGGVQIAGGGLGGTLGNIQRGINIASAVYELSESVLAPRFQQGQEDEADALGFDLMVRAGYNPDGSQRALQRLALAEEAAEQAAERAREVQEEEEREARRSGAGGGGIFGGALGGVNIAASPGSRTCRFSGRVSIPRISRSDSRQCRFASMGTRGAARQSGKLARGHDNSQLPLGQFRPRSFARGRNGGSRDLRELRGANADRRPRLYSVCSGAAEKFPGTRSRRGNGAGSGDRQS
jgi:hypothetical protein